MGQDFLDIQYVLQVGSTYHVNDAGQLEEEEGGVVGDLGILAAQEVDQPHVQVALPTSTDAKF